MGETIQTVGPLAGICGHDGTEWIKALIDAGGRLQVDIVDSGGADLKDILDELADILTELSAKLETADLDLDASGRLSTNAHGRIAGAWQKQPLIFGFSDTASALISDTNLGAGTDYVYGTLVPSGEVWHIMVLQGMTVSATCSRLWLRATVGGVHATLLDQATPVSGTYYWTDSHFILAEGDRVYLRLDGLTAGDDGYLLWLGYKMDVDL